MSETIPLNGKERASKWIARPSKPETTLRVAGGSLTLSSRSGRAAHEVYRQDSAHPFLRIFSAPLQVRIGLTRSHLPCKPIQPGRHSPPMI